MDWTLDFHGSEVHWTEVKHDVVRIRLSAAAVRQRVGAKLEEGHLKGLELRFDQATLVDGDPALCMGTLSDSTLTINGVSHRHMPLPFTATGHIKAEINFKSGSTLMLSARAVQCLLPDAPNFHTSYAC